MTTAVVLWSDAPLHHRVASVAAGTATFGSRHHQVTQRSKQQQPQRGGAEDDAGNGGDSADQIGGNMRNPSSSPNFSPSSRRKRQEIIEIVKGATNANVLGATDLSATSSARIYATKDKKDKKSSKSDKKSKSQKTSGLDGSGLAEREALLARLYVVGSGSGPGNSVPGSSPSTDRQLARLLRNSGGAEGLEIRSLDQPGQTAAVAAAARAAEAALLHAQPEKKPKFGGQFSRDMNSTADDDDDDVNGNDNSDEQLEDDILPGPGGASINSQDRRAVQPQDLGSSGSSDGNSNDDVVMEDDGKEEGDSESESEDKANGSFDGRDSNEHEHSVFTVVTGGENGELVLWRVRSNDSDIAFDGDFPSPAPSSETVPGKIEVPLRATAPTVLPVGGSYLRYNGSFSPFVRPSTTKFVPVVRPRAMLVGGHPSGQPVTGIAFLSYRAEESVASCSLDGTLCIWSAEDGRCLALREAVFAAVRPRTLCVLPSGHHIAAAGDSADIEFVDVATMSVVHRLSGHVSWVSSLMSADLLPRTLYQPMLVSASVDGIVHFWALDMLEQHSPVVGARGSVPTTQTPLQTFITDSHAGEPVCAVALSPTHRGVLIISSERWELLGARPVNDPSAKRSNQCIASVEASSHGTCSRFTGGQFLDTTHIIVWREDNSSHVYEVPELTGFRSLSLISENWLIPESPNSLRKKMKSRSSLGDSLVTVHPRPVSTMVRAREAVRSGFGYELLGGGFATTWHNNFIVVTIDGSLSLWILPRRFDETSHHQLLSTVDTSLQQEWRRLRDSLVKDQRALSMSTGVPLPTIDTHTDSTRNETTSTLLIEELMLHVTGTRSGHLVLTPLVPLQSHAKPAKTLDDSRQQKGQVIKHAVHAGAVTALLAFVDPTHSRSVPAIDTALDATGGTATGTSSSKQRDGYTVILVTAGSDFLIRVWTLSINPNSSDIRDHFQLTHLWRFAVHSGVVTKLFKPPESTQARGAVEDRFVEDRFDHAFFSISQDRSIGFFCTHSTHVRHLYGPHTDDIVDIAWQIDQDYLLAKCANHSVSVWEMSTGELESCVIGRIAEEIWDAAQPMAPELSGDYRKLLARGIAGFAPSVLIPPPQVLLINFRHLVESLQLPLLRIDRLAQGSDAETSRIAAIKKHFAQVGFQPTHGETAAISFLLPWGLDQDMDALCELELGLQPPPALSSFAIIGVGGALSLLVPDSHRFRLFGRSAYLNALVLLGARSLLVFLSHLCEVKPELSSRRRAYERLRLFLDSALAAEKSYVAPSLALLAKFWGEPSSEVSQAARELFIDTARRLSDEAMRSVVATWSVVLLESAAATVVDSKGRVKSVSGDRPARVFDDHTRRLAAVILGILGAHLRQRFVTAASVDSPADAELLAKVIAAELGSMLSDARDFGAKVVAAELLGAGFKLWKTQLQTSELQAIISKLLVLTGYQDQPTVAHTAHLALMAIGSLEPREFVVTMGKKILVIRPTTETEAQMVQTNSSEYVGVLSGDPESGLPGGVDQMAVHRAALMALGALVSHQPRSLYSLLPRICETVVQSLNPHAPQLREACLETASKVLHALVTVYPMIDFHRKTQRLALGTRDGAIVLYDLNTASRKGAPLEGHKRPVTALQFSEAGKHLASYSLDEGAVKIWVLASGFLGFGSNPSCLRTFGVDRIDNDTRQRISVLTQVRIKWLGTNAIILERDWSGPLTFKF